MTPLFWKDPATLLPVDVCVYLTDDRPVTRGMICNTNDDIAGASLNFFSLWITLIRTACLSLGYSQYITM